MAFRYIVPGTPAPLPVYAAKWRLILGLMDVCAFFPAIALAGLVVPFGVQIEYINPFPRFSMYFFSRMTPMVIAAICSTAAYGALSFLVNPLAQNYRETLTLNGELFYRLKENAQIEANEGRWIDAEKSVLVCKHIWDKSEEIQSLAEQIQIKAIEERLANAVNESRRLYHIEEFTGGQKQEIKQREPINAAEAISLAQKALDERRFYDAHWLAGVGTRLARKNGPEYKQAVLIEAAAWKSVNQMSLSIQEIEASAFYREKRNGYLAMDYEDWLKAYHIFYRLSITNAGDPDVANSLALSKEKAASAAFFLSGGELAFGEIISDGFYSLPIPSARLVMSVRYLSVFPDAAYGQDVEVAVVDHENRVLYQAKAPYLKASPPTDRENGLIVMLRSVENGEQFDPEIIGTDAGLVENAQIRLDVDYDDFILLSKIQRGLDSFFIGELFRAQENFGDYGYIPQVFQADAVYRIFGTATFLPIAVLVVILGWRFRSKRKPQYIGIPMLLILPFVFNIFILMCHEMLNKASVLFVNAIGFINSLVAFSGGTVICLFFALMGLAAQREN
jgi:hypothetical protein